MALRTVGSFHITIKSPTSSIKVHETRLTNSIMLRTTLYSLRVTKSKVAIVTKNIIKYF